MTRMYARQYDRDRQTERSLNVADKRQIEKDRGGRAGTGAWDADAGSPARWALAGHASF